LALRCAVATSRSYFASRQHLRDRQNSCLKLTEPSSDENKWFTRRRHVQLAIDFPSRPKFPSAATVSGTIQFTPFQTVAILDHEASDDSDSSTRQPDA
jgi:hypothetical protein